MNSLKRIAQAVFLILLSVVLIGGLYFLNEKRLQHTKYEEAKIYAETGERNPIEARKIIDQNAKRNAEVAKQWKAAHPYGAEFAKPRAQPQKTSGIFEPWDIIALGVLLTAGWNLVYYLNKHPQPHGKRNLNFLLPTASALLFATLGRSLILSNSGWGFLIALPFGLFCIFVFAPVAYFIVSLVIRKLTHPGVVMTLNILGLYGILVPTINYWTWPGPHAERFQACKVSEGGRFDPRSCAIDLYRLKILEK